MFHSQPLSILEEFLLLTLDDKAGDFWPVARSIFDRTTAAAVLMDLMKLHRVDCDLRRLFVTNTVPTGDDIIDPVLGVLALEPVGATRAIADELRFLSDEGEVLRERALSRLVARRVLKTEERKNFWFFGIRHMLVATGNEARAIKLRILHTVLGDEAPDPQDVALVALTDACDIFPYILNAREVALATPRIAEIARMDILGCTLVKAVAEIKASIAMASGLR